MPSDPLILVSNAGSSSLKLAAFAGERLEVRAGVERTNHTAGEPGLRLEDGDGRELGLVSPQARRTPCATGSTSAR